MNSVPGKMYCFFIIKLLSLLFFTDNCFATNNQTKNERYIDVDYEITMDHVNRKVEVAATITNVKPGTLYLGFIDTFPYIFDEGKDLFTRIRNLKLSGAENQLIDRGKEGDIHLLEVKNNLGEDLQISYTMDLSSRPYNPLISGFTNTKLNIVGFDFFVKIFQNTKQLQEKKKWLGYGLDIINKTSITIKGEPPEWRTISYPPREGGKAMVFSQIDPGDMGVIVGEYEIIEVKHKEVRIRVANDPALKEHIDTVRLSEDLINIVKYYCDLYNYTPGNDLILINNRDTSRVSLLGAQFEGQGRMQAYTAGYGWGRLFSNQKAYNQILSVAAHEIHHIWLSSDFAAKEINWRWFSEGLTEYISKKALQNLKIFPGNTVKKLIAVRDAKLNSLSIKNKVTLLEASEAANLNRETNRMIYHKGVLTAYLLDRHLNRKGESIESLLKDFIEEYAIPKIPIDSAMIITYLKTKVDDPYIFDDYIEGTETELRAPIESGLIYYWWVHKIAIIMVLVGIFFCIGCLGVFRLVRRKRNNK